MTGNLPKTTLMPLWCGICAGCYKYQGQSSKQMIPSIRKWEYMGRQLLQFFGYIMGEELWQPGKQIPKEKVMERGYEDMLQNLWCHLIAIENCCPEEKPLIMLPANRYCHKIDGSQKIVEWPEKKIHRTHY